MAKQRFINTKLWSDSWIRKLNPLDRFLFLYFLTNEHTNICGIYEVALETVSFETGIELDTLSKSMLHRLEPKVFYIDGWVFITNFEKHQRGRGSPKIAQGIENAKAEIPLQIIDKFNKRLKEKGYSMDSVSRSTNYSDIDIDIDSDKDHQPQGAVNEIGELIKLFGGINPSYGELFKRKPQRAAAERLLKLHPLSWWSEFMTAYVGVLEDRFCPKATTPAQMEDKFAAIMAYGRQRKAEGIKTKQKIWV
jgi:hypothetical protein